MSSRSEEEHELIEDDSELPEPCEETLQKINSYMTKPGRVVFVDDDNNDAWISTDIKVEPID